MVVDDSGGGGGFFFFVLFFFEIRRAWQHTERVVCNCNEPTERTGHGLKNLLQDFDASYAYFGSFTRHNILAQSIQYTENSTVCCTYVFPSRAFRK